MIAILLTMMCQSPPSADQVADAVEESVQLVTASDWTDAVNRSIKDEVPFVVMFGAEWCAPCRTMKTRLAGWSARNDIAFAYVDVGDRPDLLEVYGVGTGVPQYASWSDPRKRSARRESGSMSAAALERRLAIPAKGGVTAGRTPERSPIVRRGSVRGRWTFPGMPSAAALERHLAGSPHNYDREYLRTLTDRELIRLHDQWHNKELGWPQRSS